MVARVRTVAFEGVDVRPVDAQVQISGGMPAFTIVGPITQPLFNSISCACGSLRVTSYARCPFPPVARACRCPMKWRGL